MHAMLPHFVSNVWLLVQYFDSTTQQITTFAEELVRDASSDLTADTCLGAVNNETETARVLPGAFDVVVLWVLPTVDALQHPLQLLGGSGGPCRRRRWRVAPPIVRCAVCIAFVTLPVMSQD